MQRRINVSLSEEAVKLLDRLAPKGDRSHFLDELVKRTALDRTALGANAYFESLGLPTLEQPSLA